MADLPTVAPSAILREVVDLMIQGHSLPAIHDFIASLDGDPAKEIANAMDYFSAVAVRSKPQAVIGMVLESYREVYRKSLEAGDLSAARACLKEIQGLAMKIAEYDMEEPNDASGGGKAAKRPKRANVEAGGPPRGRKGAKASP